MLAAPYHHVYYVASGNNATFSYSFQGLNIQFIKCSVKHTNGTIDYNAPVRVNTNPDGSLTGTITFEENIPEQGAIVLIERDTPKEQDTAYGQSITFNSDNIEASFDQVVAMLQEVSDQVHNHSLMLNLFQDEPFTLDFIKEEDDGASVVIDYEGKLLKKGLYFRLNGNLEVSVNGQTYIKMPKSADILEFRQQYIDNPPRYIFQYRVGEVWHSIDLGPVTQLAQEALTKAEQGIAAAANAQTTADEALEDAAQAQKTADEALAATYQLEADKANKTDVYNKQEADAKFQAEAAARTQADAVLQEQIDAQDAKSDVVDVVGTYAELQAYDTSKLTAEDVIKVLSDSTHDDAESYYRWHDGAWVYIGGRGPFYTKAEVDTKVAAVQTEIDVINALPSVIDVVDSEDDLPSYSVSHRVVKGDVIIVRNYTGLVNDFTNTYADGEATAWRYNGGGWACIGILGSDAINKLKQKTSELQQDIDDNAGKTAELDADLQGKVDKAQGAENAGKFLKVGEDGNVTLGEYATGDFVTLDTPQTITGAKKFYTPDTTIIERTGNSSSAQPILELVGGTNHNFILTRRNGAKCVLEAGSSAGMFGTLTNHPLLVRTNYVTQMTIGTDGSVTLAQDVASTSNNNQVATTKWVNQKISQGGGGVTEVAHDDTLTGKGTTAEPLSVVKPKIILRRW